MKILKSLEEIEQFLDSFIEIDECMGRWNRKGRHDVAWANICKEFVYGYMKETMYKPEDFNEEVALDVFKHLQLSLQDIPRFP